MEIASLVRKKLLFGFFHLFLTIDHLKTVEDFLFLKRDADDILTFGKVDNFHESIFVDIVEKHFVLVRVHG